MSQWRIERRETGEETSYPSEPLLSSSAAARSVVASTLNKSNLVVSAAGGSKKDGFPSFNRWQQPHKSRVSVRFSMVCRVQVVMVVELIVNFDSMPTLVFHLIDPSLLNSVWRSRGNLLAALYWPLPMQFLNSSTPR